MPLGAKTTFTARYLTEIEVYSLVLILQFSLSYCPSYDSAALEFLTPMDLNIYQPEFLSHPKFPIFGLCMKNTK